MRRLFYLTIIVVGVGNIIRIVSVILVMKRNKRKVKVGGKIVGLLYDEKGRQIYQTERDKEGFVRKYAGFGITNKLFNEVVRYSDLIRIRYHKQDGTQEIYEVCPMVWLEKGVVDQLGGFEEQIFLGKSDFDKVR